MKDLTIYETGTGGDLKIVANDLALTTSVFTQVYLAFFGGNIEANTQGNEPEGVERFDYWGNDLLFKNQPNKQFNSNLERALYNTVYNSSGRIKIEAAAKQDLKFIPTAQVSVSLLTETRLVIAVSFNGTSQTYTWDNISKEVILENPI